MPPISEKWLTFRLGEEGEHILQHPAHLLAGSYTHPPE